MRLLVSACLLGCACRYDGQSKENAQVIALGKKHELIPVCPEQLGGLPTPRLPSEIQGENVTRRDGADVTTEYRKGACEALRLCRLLDCGGAVLKARSPSCGCGHVYDGTFSGTLIPGNGVTAQTLLDAGYSVWTEENCTEIG